MRKRVVALLCIMAMTIGLLSGCGAGKTEDTGNQNTPTKTETNKGETKDNESDKKTDAKPTAAPDSKTGSDATFKEAPMLAELVSAGKIPEVADRLPAAEDVMVEYTDSIGTYGEAMNFTYNGKGSQWWYGKVTEEGLFRFKADGSLEPNVAKGYDVNEDATVYTIYLREGFDILSYAVYIHCVMLRVAYIMDISGCDKSHIMNGFSNSCRSNPKI